MAGRSPARRGERAKPERYDELLEKAAQVFAANGFAEATIQQIAAEMDMSAPALYYYVKSKDELHYEIWKRAGAKLQAGLDEVVALDLPITEKLELAFHRHVEVILRDKPIFEVLILQRSRLPEYNRDKLVDAERHYVRTFVLLVEEYIGPQDEPEYATILAHGAIAMLNAVLRWYSPSAKLSLDEIARVYFRIFTSGQRSAASGTADCD